MSFRSLEELNEFPNLLLRVANSCICQHPFSGATWIVGRGQGSGGRCRSVLNKLLDLTRARVFT
jgi:hypothetical protein